MTNDEARALLSISANAGAQEIKSAYRAAARRYHPDNNKNDPLASFAFNKAAEAYAQLTGGKKLRQAVRRSRPGQSATPNAREHERAIRNAKLRAQANDAVRDLADLFVERVTRALQKKT